MKHLPGFGPVLLDTDRGGATLRMSRHTLETLMASVEEKDSHPEEQPVEKPATVIASNHHSKMDSLLVSVKDAGTILGISRPTIYGLIKNKSIGAVKLGGRTMVVTQSLLDYATKLPAFTVDVAG